MKYSCHRFDCNSQNSVLNTGELADTSSMLPSFVLQNLAQFCIVNISNNKSLSQLYKISYSTI